MKMLSTGRFVAALVIVIAGAPQATAQVLQPPPRPYRGLFGGGPPPDPARTRHELTVTANALGGFDDNLAPPGGGEAIVARPSGYIGFSDVTMRYWFGRDVRSIEVTGGGFMNTYRNVGVGPSYGGHMTARAQTSLGRRSRLVAAETVRYDPMFSLGVFGPLQGADVAAVAADSSAVTGLVEQQSLTTDASATVDRQWTRSLRTDLGYGFNQRTYASDVSFDSRMHSITLGVNQSVNRAAAIRGTYRRSDARYTEARGLVRSSIDHTAEVGLSFQRALSRTRRLELTGGGGAVYVDTISALTRAPLNYWTPSGYGTVRLDLGRSWNVSGDYRRSVSVLEGVSPEPFLTHALFVTSGGYLGRRVETVFTTGFSNGQAGGRTLTGELGMVDSYTGTIQLRLMLSRSWSALVSASHYQHQLNSAAVEISRVSPSMKRNAVRVGLTWSLPLFGHYLGRSERATQGRN